MRGWPSELLKRRGSWISRLITKEFLVIFSIYFHAQGIEVVRRDWCLMVRQMVEHSLHLLLRERSKEPHGGSIS